MNKKGWIIFAIILVILICGGIFFFINNSTNSNKENQNYNADKTSTNSSTESDNNNDINATNNNENQEKNKEVKQEEVPVTPQITEEQIATFSTKIYSTDSARQNNIRITCDTLNGKIVKNGETFSFCNTVGQASTSKGYEKADIFDKDGNKKKGLGGGNCQVSTTLYNALLNVPTLVVTERHEHSNKVPYVKNGKDAAVAYGSYDLKFRNNSGNDIKINAECNASSVTVNLIALKL